MTSILLSPNDFLPGLAEQLEKSPARVILWPQTLITEPESYLPLDESLDSLFGYDWLVLKNEFAADYFAMRFQSRYEPAQLDDLRVLAIGEVAAEKLVARHIHVDVTLDTLAPASTFEAIESYAGNRDALARLNFLVPSANLTRELFEEKLEDEGARVDNVMAYRTTPHKQRLAQLTALIVGGGINCMIFTRPAAVAELAQLFDTNELRRLLDGVAIVCSDAETAAAAARYGLTQTIEPDEPGVDSLTSLIRTILTDSETTT